MKNTNDKMLKNYCFAILIEVENCNPNGDPLFNNIPRTNNDGKGYITNVCLKRKIRNQAQIIGKNIFAKANDRNDDNCNSLQERFEDLVRTNTSINIDDYKEVSDLLCDTYIDVRWFGTVCAFNVNKGGSDSDKTVGISLGIKGAITLTDAVSINDVGITNKQITRSHNGCKTDKGGNTKGSDTMGTSSVVDYGLYVSFGEITHLNANKNGISDKDIDDFKQCIIHMFDNDSSNARPAGSMRVAKLIWWDNTITDLQSVLNEINANVDDYAYTNITNPYKIRKSLVITQKEEFSTPNSIDDFNISINDIGVPYTIIE